MAHPSNILPSSFVVLDEGKTVTGDFFAIQVLAAADSTMTVKGCGIFEYLNSNSGANTHMDAEGNTLGATHEAGTYEALSTQDVTLPCIVGSTIYGDFKEVTAESNDRLILYKK